MSVRLMLKLFENESELLPWYVILTYLIMERNKVLCDAIKRTT